MHGSNFIIKYLFLFLLSFCALRADLRFAPNFAKEFTQDSNFYVGEQKDFRPKYLSRQKRLYAPFAQRVEARSFNQSWQQLLAQGDFDSLRVQAQKLEKLIGSKSWHVKKFFFPAWAHKQLHAHTAIKRLLLSDRARALERIKYGSIKEAKKEIARLENSWPYSQQVVHTVVQQKEIVTYLQQVGFNELDAARRLYENRDDYELLGRPIDEQIVTILEPSKDSNEALKALSRHSNKIIAYAEKNNCSISPQIKNRIAWATDITNLCEPADFIFKIATAEYLLGDIAQIACDGQVASQKSDTNLLVRGLSKYFEYLSGPTETEIALICDTARYISDITIGSCYLSPEIREQRIAQFWQTWESISSKNSLQMSAEQIADSVAYVAARATYVMGARATISVLKNMKSMGAAAARGAALFAERFMQVFDSVVAANPAVVTNEGAVILNASKQVATEARQLVRAFDSIKDKGSDKPTAEVLDSSKKVVENESKLEKKTIGDLIKESILADKTRFTQQFLKHGGYRQALRDFESLALSCIKREFNKWGLVQRGKLGDGTWVVVRNYSKGEIGKAGLPTLEFQFGKRNIIKFRYE